MISFNFKKILIKNQYFDFYFLNQDFLFTIMSPTLYFCNLIDNIHLEGTMSQILIYVLVFILCQKTGNFLSSFATKFSRFHKIKTRA